MSRRTFESITGQKSSKYPWIKETSIGPIAVCPPNMIIPGDETDAQREDYLIWTGSSYETYGTIKRRGWRYTPGDQTLE